MIRLFLIILSIIFLSGCATTGMYERKSDMGAEIDFYNGNIDSAIKALELLEQKKDKDSALWKNELGSAYLVKGDHEKALAAFLEAFNVMNNVTAFKELERKSVGLTGAESNKGYKGDPYERMYNSLYVGLLMIKKGDLENARAAFKNGVLCDSDSSEEKYQSDDPLLFLLNARVELLLDNNSQSDIYFKQALDTLYKAGNLNIELTDRLQTKDSELRVVQDKISSICSESSETGICDQNKMTSRRKEEIDYLKKILLSKYAEIEVFRKAFVEANKPGNEPEYLKNFVNKDFNVLLVVETGQGPTKTRSGRYGEKAVFYGDNINIKKVEISIDGENVSLDPIVDDVYLQATTRGGRKMDSILKGKAQFKTDSAQTAQALGATSLVMLNQGNQSNDPNVRSAAAMMAAGTALAAGISSLMSQATNPAADIRHWSFIPNKLWAYSMKLPSGQHKVKIVAGDNLLISAMTVKDIAIDSKSNNVFFIRLFPNEGMSKDDNKFVYMTMYNDETSAKEGKARCVKDGVLYGALNVKVNALLDEKIRSAAEVLAPVVCSEAVKGKDDKYYVFKGI